MKRLSVVPGAVGVVSPSSVRMMQEIAGGTLAALCELGFRGRRVVTSADESELAALVAIGLEAPVPSLMRRVSDVPRVLWIGEPMPPSSPGRNWRGTSPRARVFESGRAMGREPATPDQVRDRLGIPRRP